MPRVPVPTGNIVERRPDTGARFQAANNNGGALGGLGAGLQQSGQSLARYAETQNDIDAQFDEAATKQQLTQYASFRTNVLSTGDKAFLTAQGQDALLARPATEKALDDKIKELSGGLKTPRAQALFARSIGAERARDGEVIASHATRQVGIWHDATDAALQASAGQDFVGATLRGDTDAADFARGTLTNSIRAQYARNGLTGEPEKQALAKTVSALHSSVIDAKSQADPVGAAAYLAAHDADLLPTDRVKLSQSLYQPLLERQASAVVDGYASHAAGLPPVTVAPPAGGGAVSSRMVAITAASESNNRDYDGNGNLVTSPKGARGRMQVMPATARDPGYGIKPSDGSREDDARVGRQKLGAMMKRYGNDPAKAWAAYNWGEGHVDGAIAKHGDAWLQHAPAETQGYVRKNLALLGGDNTPAYAPRRDDLSGIYAYIQSQNLPHDLEKAALAEADNRVARNDRLLNRQQADAKDAAYGTLDQLGDGFTSISQIPANIRRNLSPEVTHSLMEQAKQNAKPKEVPSNGDAIINLHQMANLTPDQFKTQDLRVFKPYMTRAEYDQIATLQSSMLGKGAKPVEVAHSSIWSTIGRYGPDIGVDMSAKKKGESDDAFKARRQDGMRLFSVVQGTINAITEGKRAPTDDEMRRAFDNAVIARAKPDGTVAPRYRDTTLPTNSIAVPTAAAARIAAGLKARGLPSDPQAVARFYIQGVH